MHTIAILVYQGLCHFEFATTLEVFRADNSEDKEWYELRLVAVEPAPLYSREGIQIVPHGGLELLTSANTIIIPGWRVDNQPIPAQLLAALSLAHQQHKRIISICTGTYVLAAVGILSGRRATTHWQHITEIRELYPDINIDANVLYVDEGSVLTSAGCAAGIDLCLHIIRKDFGCEAANKVARRMVVSPLRQGGQAQFVEKPIPRRERSTISVLLDKLSASPENPGNIDSMAKSLAMSRRTFLRRFQEATGTTPIEWLLWQKLDKAKILLETTDISIEHIAMQCGFGSIETLRHHFRTRLTVSPSVYRKQHSHLVLPVK